MFPLEKFLNIEHPIAGQFRPTDFGIGREIRKIGADALGETRPEAINAYELAFAKTLAAEASGRLESC